MKENEIIIDGIFQVKGLPLLDKSAGKGQKFTQLKISLGIQPRFVIETFKVQKR